jgi:uncharacterized protein
VATVAVVSDTHLPRGARELPEECLDRCRAADLILHGGDFAALSVLEQFRALGPPVEAVYGNADEPALRALLQKELVVEVEGVRLGMTHIPGPPARFSGCGAVIFGHTHLPVVERHAGIWLLNPGSPTERRRGPFHAMLVLEIAAGEIRPELVRLP